MPKQNYFRSSGKPDKANKKLENPENQKNSESFPESENNETRRNPPGHDRRGKNITLQYNIITQTNSRYDTYYE